MRKKISIPASPYKMVFLVLMCSFLLLCCFKSLYSAEKKGKDTDEIKNNIYNLYDREMGMIDEKGIIYNSYGNKLGSVDENGVIYNISDLEIGRVEPDGSVLNQSETRLGSVNGKGEIFNVSDKKVGIVKDISDIKLIGGAARLIFLK